MWVNRNSNSKNLFSNLVGFSTPISHIGYPTAAHMAKVKQLGASPIHRRSFAPLKHMTFDKHGKIIADNSNK